MRNPLLLKICVANPSSGAKVDEVYRAIEDHLENAQCYRLDRSKVTAAAIDFVVILSSAAAITTIASFLYRIWKDHRDKGELFVTIDPDKGVQIMITDGTSEIEIEDFQKEINKNRKSNQLTKMDEDILEEIKRKRYWIRTK